MNPARTVERLESIPEDLDFMHVAIPYSEKFFDNIPNTKIINSAHKSKLFEFILEPDELRAEELRSRSGEMLKNSKIPP